MLKASKHEAPLEIRSPQYRAVIDDDVDRPQVQARQRAQPSGTNSPNLSGAQSPRKEKTVAFSRRVSEGFPPWVLASVRSFLPHTPVPDPGRVRKDTQAAIARGPHLFPFRTEKLSPAAPMVLRKRESR